MVIEKYVKVINGVEHLSLEALGILSGQSADEVKAEFARQEAEHPGRFVIPPAWRRGSKELQAKHNTTDAAQLLAAVLVERGEI